jgi:subtilisin family serine protease
VQAVKRGLAGSVQFKGEGVSAKAIGVEFLGERTSCTLGSCIGFAIAIPGREMPEILPDDRGLVAPAGRAVAMDALVPPPVSVREIANPANAYRRELRVVIDQDAPAAPAIGPASVARLIGADVDPPTQFVGRWPGRTRPDATHGVHVAGVLAADANNGLGIAGAAGPTASIELSGIVRDEGVGDVAYATAVRYASQQLRAQVVNLSLGWGGDSAPPRRVDGPAADPALPSLTNAAFGAVGQDSRSLFVVAAGNEAGSLNDPAPRNQRSATRVDWEPCRPKGDGVTRRPAWPGGQRASRGGTLSFLQMPDGTYDRGNVLCVGATDRNGNVSGFSNWGAGVVDLGAPGTDIVGPLAAPDGQSGTDYQVGSGTSFAAPMVAGVAALVYDAYGDEARPWLVKCALLSAATTRAIRPPDLGATPFSGYADVPARKAFTVHGVPLAAEAISAAGVLIRRIAAARNNAGAGARVQYPTCVQKRRYYLGVFGGAWRDTPVRTP